MKASCAPLVLFTLLLAACAAAPSGQSLGPAADGPPIPAAGGTLEEQFVHQTIFSLRDSFRERDTWGFMRHVSDGFYLGRQRLSRGLEQDFAAPGVLELSVDIMDVVIDDPRVTALVGWKRSVDGAAAESGTTEVIFQKGDTLSLVNFRKDPLFGIKGF